jgi:hypothetical protein
MRDGPLRSLGSNICSRFAACDNAADQQLLAFWQDENLSQKRRPPAPFPMTRWDWLF